VESGSALVTRSGQTLGEIVASVKRVTDIIGEIAAASGEQSSGIDQVNRAVTQMDQVTQSNAAQTEEVSSTAQSLAAQARHLQQLVGRFELGREGGELLTTMTAGTMPAVRRALTAPARRPAVLPTRRTPEHGEPVLAGATTTSGHAAGHVDDGFEEF
jgi:methyl-accepting chemotaxis protein